MNQASWLRAVYTLIEHMPPEIGFVSCLLPLTYSVEALRDSIKVPVNPITYLSDIAVLAFSSTSPSVGI
ncbi:MAG: hypothetical protein ACUVTM_07120 [Candidatus Bathyarchaeia archaeon]